jgi:hypothetical protein
LHKSYLSLAAIATVEVDDIDQQERYSRLIPRIPEAPLLTLGMLLVLSIVFNIFILVMSLYRTSLSKTHPKQISFSIAGLTATTFDNKVASTGNAVDDLWDLFEESKEESPSTRVGIDENLAGGHHFVSFVDQVAQGTNPESEERHNQSGASLNTTPASVNLILHGRILRGWATT